MAISVRMPTSDAHAMSSVTHSYRKKWPISGSAKAGENSCPNAVTRVKNSSPKRDHHEPVRHRHDRQPGHPGVAEELAHQRPGARGGLPGAGGVGLAEPEDGHEVADHLGEERDRDRGDGEAQEERNDLQGWHAREFTEQ